MPERLPKLFLHYGKTPPEEPVEYILEVDLIAMLAEERAEAAAAQDFAIDEHAVAIKDDQVELRAASFALSNPFGAGIVH